MSPGTSTSRRLGSLIFAWAGGALFVVSLLYFLYFYAVTLDRPALAGGHPLGALLINILLFATFGVHHSVMARTRAKVWFGRLATPQLERATFVWVSSLLLIFVCLAWQRMPGELYHVRGGWRWVLHAVQVAGVALAIRASARLDVLELAGIRQVLHPRRHHPHTAAGLQMSGPYRLVRHPVYLGWVMLVFAAPHMTADRFAVAAISTLYLMVAVPLEERALAQAFGESYDDYARRVRWRFLPGLY